MSDEYLSRLSNKELNISSSSQNNELVQLESANKLIRIDEVEAIHNKKNHSLYTLNSFFALDDTIFDTEADSDEDSIKEYDQTTSQYKDESQIKQPDNNNSQGNSNESGNRKNNTTDHRQKPTLHRYVSKGEKLNVLKYLSELQDVKKVNKRDSLGRSAIHLAADAGNAHIMRLLLSFKEINIKLKDNKQRTAIHYAALQGSTTCMQLLLLNGADHTERDSDGYSPLEMTIIADGYNQLECAKMLFEQCDIFVHAKRWDGQTALHLSAWCGRADITEYLINQKSNINEQDTQGRTPLILAVQKDYEAIAKLLLSHGADVMILDHSNKNAFDYAKPQSSIEFILKDSTRETNCRHICKNYPIDDVIQLETQTKLLESKKKRDAIVMQLEGIVTKNISIEEQIKDANEKIKRHDECNKSRFDDIKHKFKRKQTPDQQDDRKLRGEAQNIKREKMRVQYETLEETYTGKRNLIDNKCSAIAMTDSQIKTTDEEINNFIQTRTNIQQKIEEENIKHKSVENDPEKDELDNCHGELKVKLAFMRHKSMITKEKFEREIEKLEKDIFESRILVEESDVILKNMNESLQTLKLTDQNQTDELSMINNRTITLRRKYDKLKERYVAMYEELN